MTYCVKLLHGSWRTSFIAYIVVPGTNVCINILISATFRCVCVLQMSDRMYVVLGWWQWDWRCGWVLRTVASFTKEVNPRLAKRPLVLNGRFANRGLTSLVKEATVVSWPDPFLCFLHLRMVEIAPIAMHCEIKWPVGISTVFKGHWPSPGTAQKVGKCLLLGLCKQVVKESRSATEIPRIGHNHIATFYMAQRPSRFDE